MKKAYRAPESPIVPPAILRQEVQRRENETIVQMLRPHVMAVLERTGAALGVADMITFLLRSGLGTDEKNFGVIRAILEKCKTPEEIALANRALQAYFDQKMHAYLVASAPVKEGERRPSQVPLPEIAFLVDEDLEALTLIDRQKIREVIEQVAFSGAPVPSVLEVVARLQKKSNGH